MFAIVASASLGVAGPIDWTNFSFTDFKAKYERTYTTDVLEEPRRREAFEVSKRIVLAQNQKYSAGESTWFASINAYSDLSDSEFSARKKGRVRISAGAEQ